MYGYANDEKASGSSMVFGLNQGVKMVKLEFNPNGGKDNAAQDCLDIAFEFPGGGVKNYRQFPVTKAIDKNGNQVTDPRSAEMKAAFNEFNAKISQLMKCFVSEEDLRTALGAATGFKSFCNILSGLLPRGFENTTLDVFCQYQWTSKNDNGTKYLEIPSNVKQGKVFVASEEGRYEPVTINSKESTFTFRGESHPLVSSGAKKIAIEIEGKTLIVDENKGLIYVKVSGDDVVLHPVTRTDWFMSSNFAKSSTSEEPIQSSWD
jgi:hypothetical protein